MDKKTLYICTGILALTIILCTISTFFFLYPHLKEIEVWLVAIRNS